MVLNAICRCYPRALLMFLLIASLAFPSELVKAAVVADGTYTVIAPQKQAVPFRMILTESGARIVPLDREVLTFSYPQRAALMIDRGSKSYVLLPLEVVPPLLAAGLGYDTQALGATASGSTRKVLGMQCAEVVVTGSSPRITLRAWRITDPAWSREYALLERSLALPWTAADPPAIFLGLPLAGSIEVSGRNPYKASWEITKLTRDEAVSEEFAIPRGYRMDVERLLSLQGGRGR